MTALDRFRNFAAIDWSGALGERQSGITVALCESGTAAPELIEPGQRWSRAGALAWPLQDLPPDTLVGMDLSPGLPHADAGSYFPEWADAPDEAKALWALVDAICADDRHLGVNSFLAHPEVHRHFRHHKFDVGDLFQAGAGRLRVCERAQKAMGLSPSSCMNLIGSAQVGKSSLTGMRVLHRLGGRIPVWPFNDVPTTGSLIVEIYTAISARDAGVRKGRSKLRSWSELDAALEALGSAPTGRSGPIADHASDAILTAAWLRANADRADLWRPADLTPAIARTEGWTFGVP